MIFQEVQKNENRENTHASVTVCDSVQQDSRSKKTGAEQLGYPNSNIVFSDHSEQESL